MRIDGKNIADCVALSPGRLKKFLDTLELGKREKKIAQPIFKELEERLDLMDKIGLGYLGLGRAADTLSQGESRRARTSSRRARSACSGSCGCSETEGTPS